MVSALSKLFFFPPIGLSAFQSTPNTFLFTHFYHAVFWPELNNNRAMSFRRVVGDCLRLSPLGNCSNGTYGLMEDWDTSRVADMSGMFASARSFNTDLSKWDVSRVTTMKQMFYYAVSFNADLSKWNVSLVSNMEEMFYYAISFNADLSKWDMHWPMAVNSMFYGAISFKQTLCSKAWVVFHRKHADMFYNSPGLIPHRACGACLLIVLNLRYISYFLTRFIPSPSPDTLTTLILKFSFPPPQYYRARKSKTLLSVAGTFTFTTTATTTTTPPQQMQ